MEGFGTADLDMSKVHYILQFHTSISDDVKENISKILSNIIPDGRNHMKWTKVTPCLYVINIEDSIWSEKTVYDLTKPALKGIYHCLLKNVFEITYSFDY